MRPNTILSFAALALAGALDSRPLVAQEPMPPLRPEALAAAVSRTDPAARGEFLVRQGACNDCHTPAKMGPNGPEPDMARMLSGHPESLTITKGPKLEMPWMGAASATFTAWSGPWGISFTANLTPDDNTGLGKWTEELFMKAIREGKHM